MAKVTERNALYLLLHTWAPAFAGVVRVAGDAPRAG